MNQSPAEIPEPEKKENPSPDKPVENRPVPAPLARDQELDLWWGAYSGWAMLPSFLVCVVLTGVIVWLAWTFLPRDLVQISIWGLTGAVWLAQLFRGAIRIFSFNYRLTSRRLFLDRGFQYAHRRQLELARVGEVRVERNALDQLAGVGNVVLEYEQKLVVMEGVRQPNTVADMIRQAQKAIVRSQ